MNLMSWTELERLAFYLLTMDIRRSPSPYVLTGKICNYNLAINVIFLPINPDSAPAQGSRETQGSESLSCSPI